MIKSKRMESSYLKNSDRFPIYCNFGNNVRAVILINFRRLLRPKDRISPNLLKIFIFIYEFLTSQNGKDMWYLKICIMMIIVSSKISQICCELLTNLFFTCLNPLLIGRSGSNCHRFSLFLLFRRSTTNRFERVVFDNFETF